MLFQSGDQKAHRLEVQVAESLAWLAVREKGFGALHELNVLFVRRELHLVHLRGSQRRQL